MNTGNLINWSIVFLGLLGRDWPMTRDYLLHIEFHHMINGLQPAINIRVSALKTPLELDQEKGWAEVAARNLATFTGQMILENVRRESDKE